MPNRGDSGAIGDNNMKTFRMIGMALIVAFLCVSLASCGGSSNKTSEGQKALDAALNRKGHAIDVQNSYIRSREQYKNQGDMKNAEYYDNKVKQQSKEINRLHNEAEKIRKDTYGDVFK